MFQFEITHTVASNIKVVGWDNKVVGWDNKVVGWDNKVIPNLKPLFYIPSLNWDLK